MTKKRTWPWLFAAFASVIILHAPAQGATGGGLLGPSEAQAAGKPGQASAAGEIEKALGSAGVEAARARFEDIRGKEAQAFYVSEREMITLGYRLMRKGKLPEAIAVFEMNAAAFPKSWNAWDSLAEGNYFAGDREKAEKFYKQSVELNPQNQNGKNQLSRIQGVRVDAAGETKEPLRFPAGAKTGLKGPYLGQAAPGLEPKVFAPGIVSSARAYEFALTFTPDGKEVYFTRRKDGGQNTIVVSRWEKDGWTAPEEAAFTKGFPSDEPRVTPDGKKLYFGSERPRPGSDQTDFGIWVVERTAAGAWGEPRYHGPGMYVSAASNGNLYMTDVTGVVSRNRPVILYPRTGEGYGPPQIVGGGVNAPAVADHGFIAPDESYILFDSSMRPGGQGGEGDLYVCFRQPDGSWGDAINLGDAINTPGTNFCPSVSPDRKYIFYTTCRDIYWVSAKVIERLRPQGAK